MSIDAILVKANFDLVIYLPIAIECVPVHLNLLCVLIEQTTTLY